jgi:hypothetical protein
MSGFPDKVAALQAERCLKDISISSYRFRGPVGRIRSLVNSLNHLDKWTKHYKGNIMDEQYCITI